VNPLPVEASRGEQNSTGYARRRPRGSIFGRGFDSRRLQFFHPCNGTVSASAAIRADIIKPLDVVSYCHYNL
jgi:hypothetical protein